MISVPMESSDLELHYTAWRPLFLRHFTEFGTFGSQSYTQTVWRQNV